MEDGMDWWLDLPAAVTVTDAAGKIIAMNEAAARLFAGDGGRALLGSDVFACHPEAACAKLAGLMAERRVHTYTIEKRGRRKLIHQSPWYRQGDFAGFVEISFEVPAEIPHFLRS